MGDGFGCFVLRDESAVCFGTRNDAGQLGLPNQATGPSVTGQNPVSLPAPVRVVAVGQQHACAISGNAPARVTCWGDGTRGQGGVGGALTPSHAPLEVTLHPVNSWFTNAQRQWGLPVTRDPAVAVDVAAGALHTCAVYEAPPGAEWPASVPRRVVACWGAASRGATSYTFRGGRPGCERLDAGVPMVLATPACLGRAARSPWCMMGEQVKVYAGAHHTCALVDGEARCWGANDGHQLGGCAEAPPGQRCWEVQADDIAREVTRVPPSLLDTADQCLPVVTRAPTPGGWRALALGEAHTCALDVEGGVWCWGSNALGQLGIPGRPSSVVARRVLRCNTDPVQSIAAGAFHTCALTRSGRSFCWGSNEGARALTLRPASLARPQRAATAPATSPRPLAPGSSGAASGVCETSPACATTRYSCGVGVSAVSCLPCPTPIPFPQGVSVTQVMPGSNYTLYIDNQGMTRCQPCGACPFQPVQQPAMPGCS